MLKFDLKIEFDGHQEDGIQMENDTNKLMITENDKNEAKNKEKPSEAKKEKRNLPKKKEFV